MFVRLHFDALNDNGIYFSKEEYESTYVALGLNRHQSLNDKNSLDWINDETCYDYDDLSTDMFLNQDTSDFYKVKVLLSSSRRMDIIVVIFISIVAMLMLTRCFSFWRRGQEATSDKNTVTKKITGALVLPILGSLLIVAMTAFAIHLHQVALSQLIPDDDDAGDGEGEGGGICDRDSYFPHGWYDRYPLHSYREYAYFKFFHECEMGQDYMHSITSRNCQIVAFVTSCVSLIASVFHALVIGCYGRYPPAAEDDDDDATLGSEVEIFEEHAVMKQFPLEVMEAGSS